MSVNIFISMFLEIKGQWWNEIKHKIIKTDQFFDVVKYLLKDIFILDIKFYTKITW